jgi:hypothetical protein
LKNVSNYRKKSNKNSKNPRYFEVDETTALAFAEIIPSFVLSDVWIADGGVGDAAGQAPSDLQQKTSIPCMPHSANEFWTADKQNTAANAKNRICF